MKKTLLLSAVLSLGICGFIFSSAGQAPAGTPTGANGMCNDGTYSSAATKSGACRGHKGVKQWFTSDKTPAKGAKTAPPAAAPSSAPAASSAPAPAAKAATPSASLAPASPSPAPAAVAATSPKTTKPKVAPAAGGGPGLVWLNTSTKVYHCNGDADYGTTKAGKYMSESDAKAAGGRASHGKGCS